MQDGKVANAMQMQPDVKRLRMTVVNELRIVVKS